MLKCCITVIKAILTLISSILCCSICSLHKHQNLILFSWESALGVKVKIHRLISLLGNIAGRGVQRQGNNFPKRNNKAIWASHSYSSSMNYSLSLLKSKQAHDWIASKRGCVWTCRTGCSSTIKPTICMGYRWLKNNALVDEWLKLGGTGLDSQSEKPLLSKKITLRSIASEPRKCPRSTACSIAHRQPSPINTGMPALSTGAIMVDGFCCIFGFWPAQS